MLILVTQQEKPAWIAMAPNTTTITFHIHIVTHDSVTSDVTGMKIPGTGTMDDLGGGNMTGIEITMNHLLPIQGETFLVTVKNPIGVPVAVL